MSESDSPDGRSGRSSASTIAVATETFSDATSSGSDASLSPTGIEITASAAARVAAGRPAVYEEIRLPTSLFESVSEAVIEKYDCMLYSMYESAFDVRIVGVEERLKAQQAEGEVASRLSVETGFPLLVIDRVAYTYGDRPVELRRSYCNTREHHYRNRIL